MPQLVYSLTSPATFSVNPTENQKLDDMINKGYLVISARKIFQKIRSDCVTCKKISKAVVVPMMRPLLQQEANKFNVMDHAMFVLPRSNI